jgi:hypothetical protein
MNQPLDSASTAESAEPDLGAELAGSVEGLGCPSCGGALGIVAGLRVVTCPYCEKSLLAVPEVGVRRWVVKPGIDLEKAREIGKQWLSRGWSKDSRLRREAEMGGAVLCFLPFYRVEADCIGFALGTEERRRTRGSGKQRRVVIEEVDVERSVAKSFDRTFPALNVAEWGIQRIDLRGDQLVPFEAEVLERFGMVFPPTGSEVVVKEAAIGQFKLQADPARGLKRVRFRHLQTLRERLSVIFYPLWVVRYRFRNRSYQLIVDAEDGTLAYGKSPGNDLFRAAMLVGSQALALYLGTTALQFTGGSPGALLFICAAILLALVWGWRRFRHGGVVIEGSGVDSELDLKETWTSLKDPESQERILRDLMQGRLPEIGR